MFEASSRRVLPPSRRPALAAALLVATSALLFPHPGAAQTDAEVNSGIQFNFTTPGARSLALGGAFVGLADDATAAFTNPAGLVNLTAPQVSAEGRRFTYKTAFTDRGHAFGFVTGLGVDTLEGVRSGEAEDDVASLSFLSYVHPKRRRGAPPPQQDSAAEAAARARRARQTPWALALYRHQLLSFEAAFQAQGAFFDYLGLPGGGLPGISETQRLAPVIAAIDLDIANTGVSGAYRLTRRLTLGLGVSFYEFRIQSLQQRFSTLGQDPVTREPRAPDAPGSLFGPPDFSSINEVNFQRQRGEDEDVAVNLGFFAELGKVISIGGVYRQGPEFEFIATNHAGGFVEARLGIPRGTVIAEQSARFRIPDVFGIGVALKLAGERRAPAGEESDGPAGGRQREIRISFDYNHVQYSALTDNMVSIFQSVRSPTQQAVLDGLRIDDGDELRLGFEYTFRRRKYDVYLRLGAWYDPDHKIRFGVEPGIDPETRSESIQFPGGEGVLHTSAGVGLFLAGSNLKLDAGIDLSDTVDTTSLSLVYRFGGR